MDNRYDFEGWASVWSGMTDEELEDGLFTYLWLALLHQTHTLIEWLN
jgi:hypothetical protein